MTLRGVYLRVYPQGKIAGQIVGYTGRTGRNPDGIIDNHETIWPETEGREGIEQTFNAMLTGKHGEYKMTFDKDGRKTSEKIVSPPIPGHTVVTTLDLRLQELAEKALEAKAKRGAIVIMDPNNGDILALASWPNYNPNLFVPSISPEKFKALQDDPGIPLLATRISFLLPARLDLQGCCGHRCIGKRRGYLQRAISMCPINPNR